MTLTLWEMGLAGVAGLILGLVHFAGLRWTVERLGSAHQPLLVLGGSLLLRFALLGAVIFAIGRGHPLRLLPLVAGVVMGRLWIMGRVMHGGISGKETTDDARG